MKKINNEENSKIFSEKTKLKLIYHCLNEYKCYDRYLKEDFFYNELENFEKLYNLECGISPEVLFKIFIKQRALKKMSEFIIDGDIDLEIALIDKYTPLVKSLLSKMNPMDVLDINVEEILIESLETYHGNKIFSLYVLENIKKHLKQNRQIKNNQDTSNLPKEEKLEYQIENYLNETKIQKITPSYIEWLVKHFNIMDRVENEILKKYIFLRFGYYNNIYFNNQSIIEIMNISIDECLSMYKQSLTILKMCLDEKINLALSCSLDSSKKYVILKSSNDLINNSQSL